MAPLAWDQPGSHRYEAGVDRGVLFLPDGRAVAWNGLLGVEDSTSRESNSYYMDGVKFLERQIPGPFAATLRAFTYPEEFNEVNGVVPVHDGFYYHDQNPQSFSLCYRTRIGNDLDGTDHGYRLHLLYDVMANPASSSFQTIADDLQPSEFSWALSSTPPTPTGYRPTTHISIDSTETDAARLGAIEQLLYGSETEDPRLPPPDELADLFEMYNSLVITDNGDGTWTASDLTNTYITMVGPDEFEIVGADATYVDADTYDISTTTP